MNTWVGSLSRRFLVLGTTTQELIASDEEGNSPNGLEQRTRSQNSTNPSVFQENPSKTQEGPTCGKAVFPSPNLILIPISSGSTMTRTSDDCRISKHSASSTKSCQPVWVRSSESRHDTESGGNMMDGSFACPECGEPVEVQGLTPGRQTRCGFCNRLVEIPYIPRVSEPGWRRTRFRRSWWILGGWTAFAAAVIVILASGAYRLLVRRAQHERNATINRLVESASKQRSTGAFGLALIDLDAAIDLLRAMGEVDRARLDELERTREQLARQDVETILADLTARDDRSDDRGEWLTLRARISRDQDLAPLRSKVEARFRIHLERRIETAYRDANQALEARHFGESYASCSRLARDLKALPPDVGQRWQSRLDGLLLAMARQAGVVVSTASGQSMTSKDQPAYTPKLVAAATEALQAKGYLPPPSGSSRDTLWGEAPFRLNLQVIERREGNYLGTHNRLARIEVRLTLSRAGLPFWESTPIARSTVPLPHLTPVLANRVAFSQDRIGELEDLLYEDARQKIGGRLAVSLKEIPPCPSVTNSASSSG